MTYIFIIIAAAFALGIAILYFALRYCPHDFSLSHRWFWQMMDGSPLGLRSFFFGPMVSSVPLSMSSCGSRSECSGTRFQNTCSCCIASVSYMVRQRMVKVCIRQRHVTPSEHIGRAARGWTANRSIPRYQKTFPCRDLCREGYPPAGVSTAADPAHLSECVVGYGNQYLGGRRSLGCRSRILRPTKVDSRSGLKLRFVIFLESFTFCRNTKSFLKFNTINY